MVTLSTRQQSILQFIISFFESHKFPPTIREIGEQVGISSTSVVNCNLSKLEEMELLTRQREVSRGLSLNWDKLETVGFAQPGGSVAERLASALGARVRVPVVGIIAAGQPIAAEPQNQPDPEAYIELAEGLTGPADNLFALRVKGDSMIDASVLDGDIVVLRHQNTAEDGDMVAAWIEGDEETTLKYFFRQGKEIRLQPANPNPEYRPIIKPAEKVRINGRVVSVIRMYH